MTRLPTRRDRRYPGLDQQTRWVPSRCAPSSSRVVWQRGRFRLHRSALLMLFLSGLLVGAPFVAGALIDRRFSDPVFVAMAFALVWAGAIAPLHHELAHSSVARHFGIETRASGYHLGGAYVVLHPPSTGVTPRAWIWTLSAGPISNAIVGGALLAGWSLTSGGWFTAAGLFCMLVAAIELSTSFSNLVPGPKSDGGAIVDTLRISRSALVI
ncbi:MAG: M50 family metallopeptidase [Actinomycetota bacterium]